MYYSTIQKLKLYQLKKFPANIISNIYFCCVLKYKLILYN